jgi:DNA-binding response OmpR family regulator
MYLPNNRRETMTPKILIVEDDKFLRTAYRNILKKEDFDVRIANNGKEGVEVALEWNPDVVLLDLLMPEMDGIGFLKAFDAKNKTKTKIIVQ